MISVEALNATFPKYPKTMYDKGWVYGVWYCGTSWQRHLLHGQYPPTFLKRALALFPIATSILHVPSGTLDGPGLTIDAVVDNVRHPRIQARAEALPLRDSTFDVVLSDPPYTKEDSKKYGCPPFPLGRFMNEAHRVLRPGGILGVLHMYYPSYRRTDWQLIGLIAVVTGFQRATRMFSLFQKPKKHSCFPLLPLLFLLLLQPVGMDKVIQLCKDASNIRTVVQCPPGLMPEKGDDVHHDPQWLDKALRLYCTEIPDPCDPTDLENTRSNPKIGY